MSTAIYRWTSPLFAWIPDLGGVPPRRRLALGITVSVLFHLLLILVLWLITPPAPPPPGPKISFAKSKPTMRGIELTIVPPDPEPIMPFTLAPPEQPFIESRGLEIAQEAADKPIFESDENMKAGSELPGTGHMPLPSQEGRMDRAFNAFKTQKSLLGSTRVSPSAAESFPPPSPAAAPPTPPAPAQQVAQEPPTPAEPIDPTPAKPVEPAEKIAVKPPAPPTDLREVTTPNEREIALTSKASSTPPPVTKVERAPATPTPTAQPAEASPKMAMLTKPTAPPREPAYEPEQEQTKIEGSITNRGPKGVDAIGTPMGKFKRQVNNVIGSRWLYYVKDPRKLGLYSMGSTRVVFYITSEGRIERLKVEANSSNQSFADMCLTAISDAQRADAEIFQPPAGAMEAMRDGRLEYSITFTLY